jgi:L-lactate dehydrogenase
MGARFVPLRDRRGMKVGIVGAGGVGSACAFALLHRGTAREIVLVDRERRRAAAVATDMQYGTPLLSTIDIRDGSYEDLAGSALIMITSGVNEKNGGATDRNDGDGRLKLLDLNVPIYEEIVPAIVAAAPEAVLMVVTDPPDPLADLTRRLAHHERVFSTGTVIDSMRLRVHIAQRFRVSPGAVEAMVIGEHGTSEVMLWSSARVAGVPIQDASAARGESMDTLRQRVEHEVRYANISIIEGNNASQHGIGIVCARLAEAVLRDERTVFPVATYQPSYGVTVALPTVVGREGSTSVFEPAMSRPERDQLEQSVERLRSAMSRLELSA